MAKYLFAGKTSSLIYHQSPRIIIGLFLGPVLMTSYEVVIRLPRFIKSMMGFLNSAIMPAASEISVSENKENLIKLFLRGMRYQIFFIYPVIIGAMFFAKQILTVWVGNEFSFLYKILQFVLLWNLIMPIVTYGGSIFVGMNTQLKKLALMSIITTILSLVISLSLVWRYDLNGVFIGYVSSLLIIFPFYLITYLKEFGVKTSYFLKELLISIITSCIPVAIIVLLNQVVSGYDLVNLIIKYLVWCLFYWCSLYFFILSEEDRKLITKIVPIFSRN